MEPFVVSINTAGQAAYRRRWAGPLGTVVLIVPGLIVAVLGVVLGLAASGGVSVFFAAVIAFSGLYASYAGWDHRRRALQVPETAPLAFLLEQGGPIFPRDKRYAWSEVRFVLTAEDPPRILCTPAGLAYTVDHLDRTPESIDEALATMSSGQIRLEQV